MHHIRKLEILGFKSFCDRTSIVFNEGVTAIVGPNGCGKSNISDAISWVVGEQSAKSLRTDRMEGVIFNGTEARRATSLCEVVLSLSLPREAPIPDGLDVDPADLMVGRRLYRSGESEYTLDGRRCRLKDIQALLEGTGLGPNSYALIEQGRVGQILSSRPADRRSLIEEAARITLFKSRRYSAEMKLELAQQNLLRVHDIVREVERQLNSLKRQAAKARRYNRMREELRAIHRLRLALERRQITDRLEECSARFAAAQGREAELAAELARAAEARVEAVEACRRQDDLVARLRDELARLQVSAERARNAAEHQQVQAADCRTRAVELERDEQALEERAALVASEQERIGRALAALCDEIAEHQERLAGEQLRADSLASAARRAEERIDELRSLLLASAGRLTELRNVQARCLESLERIEAQGARLVAERAAKARDREALGGSLDRLRSGAAANEATQQEVEARITDWELTRESLDRRVDRVGAELAGLQEEYSLLQHRYASLEEIEARRSNYSEGVQKFLSTELPGEETSRAQTLADHIETDPRYEAAVEDYLNDPLQYILVDRIDDAVSGVERLRRIGAGKCTFMALRNGGHGSGKVRPPLAGEGIIGYLDELLRMRDDVKHAFERALPDYAATVMVADLDTAFRAAETGAGSSFLTLAGEAYSPRGTLSAVGGRKSMAGFLALKREMRDLVVKLQALSGKIDVAREELARLKGEQTGAAEALKTLSIRARTLEVEGVGVRHELATLESELRKVDQSEAVAAAELAALDDERTRLEARRDDATSGIETIEQGGRAGEEELRDLSGRLDPLRGESAAAARSLTAMLSAHAVRRERRSTFESEVERLGRESGDMRARLQSSRIEREGTLARARSLELARAETLLEIDRLAEAVAAGREGLERRQSELALDRERLQSIEQGMERLQGEREEAMEQRGRIEIEKARLESDLEHLGRTALEEFHAALEEVVSQVEPSGLERDLAEVCRSYEELRGRIEGFGAINMRALEEYRELEERHQFLAAQRADIEKSIADTQKAIAEINRRSIEQFQDAFTRIRCNFVEVFQILFQGGQCDLRLLDEEDMLESGLDIIAQPPGKRLQNVLLLSGGEKALTALALLIAIFRYRPSPFCVLDEVDAPLDDANVRRFTNLIKELSKETQFIIITHNKQTMEIAQTLYGVTMEEPGVSKILGVDFRSRSEALAS